MTRKLSILFITLILIITLVGCNNEPIEEDVSTTPEPITEPTEVIDISLALWNMMPASGSDDPAMLIYDYIRDNFLLNITPWQISYEEDWNSRIQTAAATDVLPDFFVYEGLNDKEQLLDWANRGVIRGIPDTMWYQYRNVYTTLSWYDNQIRQPDGLIYFMPRTDLAFDQTQGQSSGIYYRKDWARELGYEVGSELSWTSFIELAYDIALQDPDGDTKVDTWGITGSSTDGVYKLFYETFGVREWVLEDGEWVYGMTSNRAKEATQWMNELYRDGVLDKDIFTATPEETIKKFAVESAGMMLYDALPTSSGYFESEIWNVYMPDRNIEDYVALLPLPKNSYSVTYNEIKTYSTGTMVSGDVDDVTLNQFLKLYDWLLDDDGLVYTKYGIEGTHFTNDGADAASLLTDENGEPVWFEQAAINASPISKLATYNKEGITYIQPLSNFQHASQQVLENSYYANNWHNVMFTNMIYDSDFAGFNPVDSIGAWLPKLAFESNDFDGLWDTYVEEITNNTEYENAKNVVNQYASDNSITSEE